MSLQMYSAGRRV